MVQDMTMIEGWNGNPMVVDRWIVLGRHMLALNRSTNFCLDLVAPLQSFC